MSDEINETLRKQIEKATPAKLDTASMRTEDENDSFGDIVADIVDGGTTVDDVEQRLIDWANRKLDVPFVPESIEEKMLSVGLSLLKSAAAEAAKSAAKSA